MRYFIILALLTTFLITGTSQVCSTLDDWSLTSENGDGTCTYSVTVTVDSGNGASGTATFSIGGTTVHTESSCTCNPTSITFPITVNCGSSIDIDVFYDAPGNGNDCTGSTGNVSLPVEWISFEILNNGDKNIINWSAYEDFNHRAYIVERSQNGIDFRSIGSKSTDLINPYTPSEYSYSDENPYSGINYYRIKQIDFNNKEAYSEIIATKNSLLIDDTSIFPNPFEDIITIKTNSVVSWKLVNLNGITLLNGSDKHISTSFLPAGAYYFQVYGESFNKTELLIKK